MKQFVLVCQCQSYIIPEINRTFYLGDNWVLSEREYNQPFIQRVLQIGVFSVTVKQECRMKKLPPPTKIPPFVKLRKGVPKTNNTPQKIESGVSEQKLKEIVRSEVAQMKQQIVKEISGLIQQQTPQLDMEALGQLITKSIQASMPTGVSPQTSTRPLHKIEEEDEPIYIPSNITGSGIVSGSSLSVESISTDNSVNDAASALRAMKKKRKK